MSSQTIEWKNENNIFNGMAVVSSPPNFKSIIRLLRVMRKITCGMCVHGNFKNKTFCLFEGEVESGVRQYRHRK